MSRRSPLSLPAGHLSASPSGRVLSTESRGTWPFASGFFHGAACLQGSSTPMSALSVLPAESRCIVWVARISFPSHPLGDTGSRPPLGRCGSAAVSVDVPTCVWAPPSARPGTAGPRGWRLPSQTPSLKRVSQWDESLGLSGKSHAHTVRQSAGCVQQRRVSGDGVHALIQKHFTGKKC